MQSRLKSVDKMKGYVCRSSLVCREIKKAENKDELLGPEDISSTMPPSEGLKILVSTMTTGHDDDGWTIEMATWDVSIQERTWVVWVHVHIWSVVSLKTQSVACGFTFVPILFPCCGL